MSRKEILCRIVKQSNKKIVFKFFSSSLLVPQFKIKRLFAMKGILRHIFKTEVFFPSRTPGSVEDFNPIWMGLIKGISSGLSSKTLKFDVFHIFSHGKRDTTLQTFFLNSLKVIDSSIIMCQSSKRLFNKY